MTAVADAGHGAFPARHPLAPGAIPAAVRAHLLVEDRPLFDAALERAQRTSEGGDVATVVETLEKWRCIAIVQRDRATFARTARRLAEQNTGRPSPADEPLAVTRAKAGL